MTLELFFQMLINSLMTAGVYGIVACGFTIVLGVMKIFNFAHGELYMMGAYLAFGVTGVLGAPYIVAIIAGFVSMALVGMLMQRLIIRYTYSGFFHTVLATIAIGMILTQTSVLTFGKTDRYVSSPFGGTTRVDNVIIPNDRLSLIIITILILVGLYYFMKLKIGKAMRSVAEDQQTAELQGINSRYIFLATMALGCGLAGVSGALVVPVLGATAAMGTSIFIKALTIIIIGGMGSMPGALLAALLIGIIESFGFQYIGALNQILVFIILLPILFLRPGGLLGRPLAIPE